MLQWFRDRDQFLQLLVCGLGIQFAGPAANAALILIAPPHLVPDARHLLTYLLPVCNVAMLAIWVYAVARQPKGGSGQLRIAA